MTVWDDVLTGLDRQVYEQFRGTKDLGKRPALVVVDVNYAFAGLQAEPILDSIKTFHTSCGERAWKVIPGGGEDRRPVLVIPVSPCSRRSSRQEVIAADIVRFLYCTVSFGSMSPRFLRILK